jgi:hypothetical protein
MHTLDREDPLKMDSIMQGVFSYLILFNEVGINVCLFFKSEWYKCSHVQISFKTGVDFGLQSQWVRWIHNEKQAMVLIEVRK